MKNNCIHIYQNVGASTCPHCGKHTHEVDWKKQTALQVQWKIDNPNAKSDGWWSI